MIQKRYNVPRKPFFSMQYPIKCHFNKYGNCVPYEYPELRIFVAIKSVNDENLKSEKRVIT